MNVKLLVVQGRPQGKTLAFSPGEFVVGRGAECHIRPNSDWVSRQHCLLRVTDTAVYIRDLASRNGTLINGERLVGERSLADGDQVQVGPLVFQVQMEVPTLSDAAVPIATVPDKPQETSVQCVDSQEMIDLEGDAPEGPTSTATTDFPPLSQPSSE